MDVRETTIFRTQLLAFSLITSLLIYQYEPLMTDRGIPLSVSLLVYSISQMVILLATIFWGRTVAIIQNGIRIIQFSLCVRLIITGMMFFTEKNLLFLALFLVYHTVSSSIDIVFEGMLGRWAYMHKQHFGKFRLFGSIGYATSGFVASFLYGITHQINDLLLFIIAINGIILAGTFFYPLKVEMHPEKIDIKKAPLNLRVQCFILLGALITTLPNSFGVVLNNHYRTTLHLGLPEASLYAGMALFIGSCLSECAGFYFVDRWIERFQAKNVILAGMLLCVVRWLIAFLAEGPLLFTFTYLFHGVSYALIYLGCVAVVRDKCGEASVTGTVIQFSLVATLIGFLFTQLFSVVLTFTATSFLLGLFLTISVIVSFFYFYFYWK